MSKVQGQPRPAEHPRSPHGPRHVPGAEMPSAAPDVTVAALYVDPKGAYANLPGVEVWDEARDARTYNGPWPIVAHPPCARWSRLAGFTEARFGYKRGEDGGCFAAALESVRTFGGVIEHPAYTDAWKAYDLPKPTWRGGWTSSLLDAGASCYVEQGRYGLPVKKGTWLYAYGVGLPDLKWGFTPDAAGTNPRDVNPRGVRGGSRAWRDAFTADEPEQPHGIGGFWKSHRHDGMRSSTPPAFRDVLLAMARSAAREQVAALA